jgi:Mg2+ and Co2+ transporter CorA
LNVFTRFDDGHTVVSSDAERLSAAFLDPFAEFWVDFYAPTDHDYAFLKDLFGFHPLAVEDILHEAQRPKLESYAIVGDRLKTDYVFLVIYGPDTDPGPRLSVPDDRTGYFLFANILPQHLYVEYNNRLNRIMKTLAIISVVTLLLTVITSFFGMDFADTIPGFTKPFTFAAAMLQMICLPFVFLFLFRKNDWL